MGLGAHLKSTKRYTEDDDTFKPHKTTFEEGHKNFPTHLEKRDFVGN